MMLRSLCLITILTLASAGVRAQDCTLGVGGKDTELIVQVFQLDSLQQSQLQGWIGELEEVNAPLEQKARVLLDTHPQKTDEDLAALGHKYDAIKLEMVANAAHYDRLLLGTFTERQYARYVQLCREVYRAPLTPIRQE